MKITDAPTKIVLPFAEDGLRNSIPVPSQIPITDGAASYTDGFPPLTMQNKDSGGLPPDGEDMNGILYALSALIRWANAGAGFNYDSTFATDGDVGGYPAGAMVLRTDEVGYWLNTTDDNTSDPEAGGAGWVPAFTNGISAVTMTGSNVTLTSLQAGKPIIAITGTLSGNLNLVFPNTVQQWLVVNGTTGAYTITAKTSAGTGVVVTQGAVTAVYGDGTNIAQAVPTATTTIPGVQRNGTQAEVDAATSGVTVTPDTLANYPTVDKLLASGSIGSVATLDFSLSTLDPNQNANNRYKVVLDGFQPATDDVPLYGRISSDGGSTFISTGNYWTSNLANDTPGIQTFNNSNGNMMLLVGQGAAGNEMSNVANEAGHITLELIGFNTGSSVRPVVRFAGDYWESDGSFVSLNGTATINLQADYDAIRFYFSSGNFAAAGTYKLYKTH
jgi:hypothetical protein